MVVGVLTTSYPRARGDFAGGFVADRVQALIAAGHAVEVLAGGAPDAPHTIRAGAVTVTRLPSRFGGGPDLFGGAGAPEALEEGRASALLAAARFSACLAAEARARAPRWDRIESHWLAPSALAALAAAPHLPHRAFAHSGDVALLERVPLGRTLARRLAASGAELVFVSAALRARFARLAGRTTGRVEAMQVPAALFPRRARPDPAARAALGVRGPMAIAVGRLVPIKGHDLLVRAAARVTARAAPPLQLFIVGDGPERERLTALAARLGVSLRMPGRVARDQVAAYLRAADLFVQPSRVLGGHRTEGLPVATLEALAVGLPVVASDAGGLAELAARAGQVDLFAPGDAAALAACISHRLSAPCIDRVSPA